MKLDLAPLGDLVSAFFARFRDAGCNRLSSALFWARSDWRRLSKHHNLIFFALVQLL